jgi:hypothetical protein
MENKRGVMETDRQIESRIIKMTGGIDDFTKIRQGNPNGKRGRARPPRTDREGQGQATPV